MGASRKNRDKRVEDFCRALLQLKTIEECRPFLLDLLSPQERAVMAKRWAIVLALNEGEPHREIAVKLKCGTYTVTRVNRALQGEDGGYRLVLERLKSSSES